MIEHLLSWWRGALDNPSPWSSWSAVFLLGVLEGSDACFAPVLDFDEAAAHPHNVARGMFVEVAGQRQPAPAPRLSRTPAREPTPGIVIGQHTDEVLVELGVSTDEVTSLREARAAVQAGQ